MKKIILSIIAIGSLSVVSSCKTDFDRDASNVTLTSGTANFTKYVSIGNSLTSGYRDGTLYLDGQNESYPSMISQQMNKVGGSLTFVQPLMPNNTGGFTDLFAASGGKDFYGKLVLSVVNGSLSPVPSAPAANLDKIGGTGKYFNNMGVPGAKSYHLVAAGYGNPAYLSSGKANPYFVRFATSATTSVLADAVAQKPTFYSLWIGNNDVLSYATTGGVGVDRTGNLDPTTYGSNDISDPNVVKSVTNTVISTLKTAGASKGVIANIPYVTNIPFFTTVPYNPLTAKTLGGGDATVGAALIDQLNTGLYGPVISILTAYGQGSRISLLSKTSGNPLLIRDETLTSYSSQITAALVSKGVDVPTATAIGLTFGQARQATSSDLVLLTTQSVIGKAPSTTTYPYAQGSLNKYGITFPLDDGHVLIPSEISAIKTATDAYNSNITALASTYGLALVDANSAMQQLNSASGISYNSVTYTASFVTGGAFSLDGVHPTGRGYGIIANEFIKAINAKYGSTLPLVNPNNYSGVTFP